MSWVLGRKQKKVYEKAGNILCCRNNEFRLKICELLVKTSVYNKCADEYIDIGILMSKSDI